MSRADWTDSLLLSGNALLVKPVTSAGVSSMNVYLPRTASDLPPIKWYPFKGSSGSKAGLFSKIWNHIQVCWLVIDQVLFAMHSVRLTTVGTVC